ncbi:sulfotransferase family protein [Anderseniella sp. Alg231-50]|uniref:sulfotransferase family protein n=1 Tax=Anderseniella sp. Alg231-50 TaxID=1922226 RepID=UPI00307C1051
MHVLTRFPSVKKFENKLVQSYIGLLSKRREKQWQERALPDFIIIGGMKCGTSSLFKYLNQHPQLFSSDYKEVRYFSHDEHFSRGEKWYRIHFPLAQDIPENSLIFEASPDYLFYPRAAERMASLLPDIKLIALLRNPTERAISHYFHDLKKGRKQGEIFNTIKNDREIYKLKGAYKMQLERYYKLFPADNIMIINSENFFEDPVKTLKEICLFLDVDPDVEISDLSPQQVGFNREPVDAAVYDYLNGYYKPFNQALFDFIGKTFKW